ncbi:MAG: alpha/beta fold hydrolase [Isosphaeraceae bacterium]|nr:alpha/beta fold hydrolase [Isosphaeraceae bacterium]
MRFEHHRVPGSRVGRSLRWLGLLGVLASSGCATMRHHAPIADLRPCDQSFAETDDGWKIGVRRIRPMRPDPGKLPVVLCHGLGLNGTFWTIAGGEHLPKQLADRGYEVFIVDMRGSGASRRLGGVGRVNALLRQTPFLEIGDGDWNVDDQANRDVPAILRHVERETGASRVNWVGHSLGGMLMLAHLETTPEPGRIANFVDMGGVVALAPSKARGQMLQANRGICALLRVMSTGRIARPMMWLRLPGLEKVDRFYYTSANVDKQTVSRFYGYTLENPGRGALRQLDPYLEFGHMVSADRRFDYVDHLDRVHTPILMIAGEGDLMADIPSTYLTYDGISSKDKTLLRYGKVQGHIHDYGHCDLVWSRHASAEIFPNLIDWLDRRQPGVSASPQSASPQSTDGSGRVASPQISLAPSSQGDPARPTILSPLEPPSVATGP